MKIISTFLVLLCAATPSFSQSIRAKHPSVELPPELARILRDYENGWATSQPDSLAALFTKDGFALPSGRPPSRGQKEISAAYARARGSLALRALAYKVDGAVGYIVGAYSYDDAGDDTGKFVLAIRKSDSGTWLIAADIDNSIRRNDN